MLSRGSLYQTDMLARPLIEREYMESRSERPPTPSPSSDGWRAPPSTIHTSEQRERAQRPITVRRNVSSSLHEQMDPYIKDCATCRGMQETRGSARKTNLDGSTWVTATCSMLSTLLQQFDCMDYDEQCACPSSDRLGMHRKLSESTVC